MEPKIATGTSEGLIDALDFKLPDVAAYIVDRASAAFMPQGGNAYTPKGVRLIRFVLAGNMQFLDPTTVRLYFNVLNTSPMPAGPGAVAPTVQLLGPAYSLFYRGRLLVNGTLVEDIMYWGRTMLMWNKLIPFERAANDTLEADWQYPIPGGKMRRYCLPLPFGLFTQHLCLWLKVAPITIELELPLDYGDCIADATATWQIQDVQLKADCLYTTTEFSDQYAQMLLENVPIPIPLQSCAVQMQTVPAGADSFSININRAFTRLKAIFFTFY